MLTRRDSPYIWVTWIAKLLAGENSCEWAAWFKAHHQGYEKATDTDFNNWRLEHTAIIHRVRDDIRDDGALTIENQNRFTMKGKVATLGGCPDLVLVNGTKGTVYDVKSGQRRPAHDAQVLVYMWALPRAFKKFADVQFDGKLIYPNDEVDVPKSALDQRFQDSLVEMIGRISSPTPAIRVPSSTECGFCEITETDCGEKVEGILAGVAETDAF